MPVQDVGTPHKKKEHTNIKQLFITEVDYQQTSGCSRGNIDNIRRILSSFWHGWRTISRILWTLSKTDDIINVDFYAKESLI